MPTPQGDITTTEIWSQPEEESQDDLSTVPDSGGTESAEEDQTSEE
jgi:hypothetical protein